MRPDAGAVALPSAVLIRLDSGETLWPPPGCSPCAPSLATASACSELRSLSVVVASACHMNGPWSAHSANRNPEKRIAVLSSPSPVTSQPT
eukprot:COSAG06_NODE_40583_length_400_cov_1.259136_1_plen_90_part_01